MLLKELKNKKLGNWTLKNVYYIHLKHNLMGMFPLVKKGTDHIVLSENIEDLKKIWENLKHRYQVRLEKINAMVNEKERFAIPIDTIQGDDANSDEWMYVNQVEECNVSEMFEFTSGLIGAQNDAARFPEI